MSTSVNTVTAPSQGRIGTLAAASALAVAATKECDKSYSSCWTQFTQFVAHSRDTGALPTGDKYLTRENIDFFFLEVIANKTCAPATSRRYVSALQWFATNVEYVEVLCGEKFNIESPIVTTALSEQKGKYLQKSNRKIQQKDNLPAAPMSEVVPLPDPFAKLKTNVIKPEDTVKAMTYAIDNEPNWGSACIC